MGLKAARERREESRRLLANGIDPSLNRKVQRAARAEQVANSFEATEQGYSFSEASRRLGVHVSLLRRWREPLEGEGRGEGLSGKEHEELRRLRVENKRLQMEREILKKAAAFFAKESS